MLIWKQSGAPSIVAMKDNESEEMLIILNNLIANEGGSS